jgi:hypothetical protein
MAISELTKLLSNQRERFHPLSPDFQRKLSSLRTSKIIFTGSNWENYRKSSWSLRDLNVGTIKLGRETVMGGLGHISHTASSISNTGAHFTLGTPMGKDIEHKQWHIIIADGQDTFFDTVQSRLIIAGRKRI